MPLQSITGTCLMPISFRHGLLTLALVVGIGCGSSSPSVDPSATSQPQASPTGPSARIKWAETADFRGEVPTLWNVMPNSITPSAADSLTNVKSGLLIGIPQTQPSTNPLPIVFSVVFLTPKHEQIKNQFVIDSLLEVSRRGKVQTDDVIPLAGLSGNRVA